MRRKKKKKKKNHFNTEQSGEIYEMEKKKSRKITSISNRQINYMKWKKQEK